MQSAVSAFLRFNFCGRFLSSIVEDTSAAVGNDGDKERVSTLPLLQ